MEPRGLVHMLDKQHTLHKVAEAAVVEPVAVLHTKLLMVLGSIGVDS